VIPEFGFGDDVVSSEESQSIDFGVGILFSGLFSAHNKELPDLRLMNNLPSFEVKSQLDLGCP
jgi:hypothetical protein